MNNVEFYLIMPDEPNALTVNLNNLEEYFGLCWVEIKNLTFKSGLTSAAVLMKSTHEALRNFINSKLCEKLNWSIDGYNVYSLFKKN